MMKLSGQLFIPLTYTDKSIEVRSLLDQIEKQYITVGQKMGDLLERKSIDQGETIKKRDFMDGQRGYTWKIPRASLFIFSVFTQQPILPIILYRGDSLSQYKKTIDGQQRQTTLWMYVNDKFALDMSKADFTRFKIGSEEHAVNELNGKLFSELPQEWQDSILNYSFKFIIYNNCSDEQAERIYSNIAMGTEPLKPIEIRKASMGQEVRKFIYQILGPWTLHVMTSSSATGNFGLDITSQFLALQKNDGPIELSRENIDHAIYDLRDLGIPDDIKENSLKTADFLNHVFEVWIQKKKEATETQTKGRKVKNFEKYRFPVFKNKTYVLMFIWAAYKASIENIDTAVFQKWASEFFENPSVQFKKGLGTNSNKPGDLENVSIRMKAVEEEVEKLK